MISGDLGSVGKEWLQELRGEIKDVESVDQVSGKQTLGSLNP